MTPESGWIAAGIDPATAHAIRAVAAGALAGDNAVGGVLGVTSADELLAVIPVGSLDPAGLAPMPAGALMPIASCSKTFLAVLALQEREAGRLDFDAPISDYLPWFAPETIDGEVTVHHCLTHTTGLPWGRCFTGEAEHSALLLAQVDQPLRVGSLGYSNEAVNLVGLAIERVCRRPVHALLRERLLDPLGMADSSAALTPAVRVGCAPGWVSAFDDRPLQGSHPVVAAPWVNGVTADGSISASAPDLCSFIRFLLRGCRGDPSPLLAQRLVRAASRVVRLVPHGMLATYRRTRRSATGSSRERWTGTTALAHGQARRLLLGVRARPDDRSRRRLARQRRVERGADRALRAGGAPAERGVRTSRAGEFPVAPATETLRAGSTS